MKHVKTLGLLAVAVMALTAVFGTASASAVPTFTAGAVGAEFETTQIEKDRFTVTGSNVECSNISYGGTTEALDSGTQLVHPKYTGCVAFGFSEANGTKIEVKNCKYTLAATGSVKILKTNTSEDCEITITVDNIFAKCMVTVLPQEITGVSYANGANNDIVITVNSSNITARVDSASGFCPLKTEGTPHTNAEYHAKTTVKAVGTTLAYDA